MRDEQQLLQLRPDLQLTPHPSKPDEQFQNQTLRPILKLQHPLLVKLFETAHEAECSRRLVSLIIQRLQSVDYEADLKVSGVQGIKLKAVKEVAV